MLNKVRFLIYPILIAMSKILSGFVPLINALHLNSVWSLLMFLLPRRGKYVKSVYGPFVHRGLDDHQFYLCASGKGGYKLSSIIARINQKMVFLDIGSNIGIYSLLAERNPNFCRITAVEANPFAFDFLKSNIDANYASRIEVIPSAVSEFSDQEELNYNDWQMRMGTIERFGNKAVKVKSLSRTFFDAYAESINEKVFLKIDVEGAENVVIQEVFSSTLSDKITDIFIQATPTSLDTEKIDAIYSSLYRRGFKLLWKGKENSQYEAYLSKNDIYVSLDKARNEFKLKKKKCPIYSICISNYNMADTIYRAVSSVAEQLDDKFEIIIVDDGSTDNSRDEILRLESKFPIVRSLFMKRDKNRWLGETRNISIYAALGKYVLLHIDADDIWKAFLKDLLVLFHKLEEAYGYDFLLVGQQTGIAKRDLLLSSGGYDNIYRGEDRNLMFKMAALDKILFMDYKTFRTRLKRPTKKKFIKVIWDMWSHLQYDFLYTESKINYLLVALFFSYNNKDFTYRSRLLRSSLALPALFSIVFKDKPDIFMTWSQFMLFRESHRGNFDKLMQKIGKSSNLKQHVSKAAFEIFDYQVNNKGFKGE
jgi:FkbM family methyltransferase